MKLTPEQIDFIKNNERIIFATASKAGTPRASVVIPSHVEENRIIISDVQMGASKKNILENNQAFVSSYKDDTQIKVSGTAEYKDSGKLFGDIKQFEESRDVDIKGIIVIDIKEIEQTEG
jgi:uncharacterized pyridoxamine 5'-phosphate oxidase family protein